MSRPNSTLKTIKPAKRPAVHPARRKKRVHLKRQLVDDDTRQHYLHLGFIRDARGSDIDDLVIGRELRSEPRNVLREINRFGGHSTITVDDIDKALNADPPATVRTTAGVGWRGEVYVEQGQTFGKKRQPRHAQNGYVSKPRPSRGTVPDWKAGLEGPCKNSPILTFLISTAFAGPILDLVDERENVGFYCYGQSTTGKTSAARCAHSVRYSGQKDDLPTFDTTSRALEERLALGNDGTTVIDEAERLSSDAKERRMFLRQFAYVTASGVGKERSAYAQRNADLQNRRWRGFVICNGESPLGHARADGGDSVRLIGIPVPGHAEGGIFASSAQRSEKLATFVRSQLTQIETTISQNFGVAFPAFMTALCSDLDRAKVVARRAVKVFQKHVLARCDAQERRIGEKFAIVYAAGILARLYGVAPWDVGVLRRSVRAVFAEAISDRSGVRVSVNDILKELKSYGQDPAEAPRLRKPMRLPRAAANQAAGLTRRERGKPKQLLILRSHFLRMCGDNEVVAHTVFDELLSRGIAIRGNQSRTTQVQTDAFAEVLKNPRPRFYAFNLDKLLSIKT